MFQELGSWSTNFRTSPLMIIAGQSPTTTSGDSTGKILTTNFGGHRQPTFGCHRSTNLWLPPINLETFINFLGFKANLWWSSSANLWPPPPVTPSTNFQQPTLAIVATNQPWKFLIKIFLEFRLVFSDRRWLIFNHHSQWLYQETFENQLQQLLPPINLEKF